MNNAQVTNQTPVRVGPIFGVMIAGAFIAFLNQTLMNVALPQMMNSLHIAATTGDWLTTIYMLVNGIVIPMTAYLMERFTTRQLYITAMVLFAVGTLVCAIGPNFSIILVGRVIQAAGAGVLMPLLTNVIFTLFPDGKRGMAMGILGIALNFAPAVGPTLSGWIVGNYSWRILFYIILPIAIADLIVSVFLLKNVSETGRPKLDVFGVILSTIGFGGVLYGFSVAGDNGWGSTDVITMFCVGGVSLVIFVWRQWVVAHPILEFRIFRYPMFTLTTMINVLITMALYSGMILMPIYMQDARGFSPIMSGLLLLPGGIVMGIMSPITGKLYDRIGARWLSVVGLAISIVTTYALANLHMTTTFFYVLVLYTIRMFGISILLMPIMTAGLNELPLNLNRYGTALLNTLRMIAGAIGMAFFVTIMTNKSTSYGKSLAIQQHVAATDKAKMAIISNKALVVGINEAFLVATLLTVLAFILAFFVKRTTPKEDLISNRVHQKRNKQKKTVKNVVVGD